MFSEEVYVPEEMFHSRDTNEMYQYHKLKENMQWHLREAYSNNLCFFEKMFVLKYSI